MTTSDLDQFEHRDHKLIQNDNLSTVFVTAPAVPDYQNTQGGPVYVSVGQHLKFEVTDLYTGQLIEDE